MTAYDECYFVILWVDTALNMSAHFRHRLLVGSGLRTQTHLQLDLIAIHNIQHLPNNYCSHFSNSAVAGVTFRPHTFDSLTFLKN